ncbi:MAG: hypothetical protein Q4B26_03200 [Eubacteriales bacterium]|nr:hypothetical protein [Eubacteriales bacterium]
MEIYYQGVNITDKVQCRKCIVRDTAGKRCDSLEIEFENAAGWYRWGPEEDDQIVIKHGSYDSGVMFVNKVIPEDGKYRIFATSLPCNARAKRNQSFIKKSIEEIMRTCAMISGMSFSVYGIDGKTIIPYVEQEKEGCAAFLSRLLMLEGAVLKCVNGKYTAIGIDYAQNRAALRSAELTADKAGVLYRRDGETFYKIIVKTPYASATATDWAVPSSHEQVLVNDLPALNNIQAGRWARGILTHLNRQCETVILQTDFSAMFTAMARMDIHGNTDASGKWLIEDVEHDLINLKSKVTMHRCIESVS